MCQDCKLFMTETNELISCSTSPGNSRRPLAKSGILHSASIMAANKIEPNIIIPFPLISSVVMEGTIWDNAMRSRYQESDLSTKDWEARCGAKILKSHGCEKVDRKISRFTA
ncbi:hypothetical protein ALC56_01109 [Trachymyrmex septentrionalis]|uniref:Uncharacterized protein n=1 Tax=Trachymyrmex septentrionalis TaxID=34720 RepID=A0A195FVF8_9HYME|nr:hypothetical protein ALC56_01109 [Trachymyrmex septentrionalis]